MLLLHINYHGLVVAYIYVLFVLGNQLAVLQHQSCAFHLREILLHAKVHRDEFPDHVFFGGVLNDDFLLDNSLNESVLVFQEGNVFDYFGDQELLSLLIVNKSLREELLHDIQLGLILAYFALVVEQHVVLAADGFL